MARLKPLSRVMSVAGGCFIISGLSGCEAMWHTLHAIDTAQTIHIARNPECFYERAPLTRAIIGKHPSEGEVAAVMVGYSLLHKYLADRLEGNWLKTYQIVSIATSARNVYNNHQLGLRPFGAGCP